MSRLLGLTTAGLIAGLAFFAAGCATVMTPAELSAKRGSGTRSVIAGSPVEIMNVFEQNYAAHGFSVTRERDTAYAIHSLGVNVALFLSPGADPGRTQVEVYMAAGLVGRGTMRQDEADLIKFISEKVAAGQGRQRPPRNEEPSPSVAAAPSVDAGVLGGVLSEFTGANAAGSRTPAARGADWQSDAAGSQTPAAHDAGWQSDAAVSGAAETPSRPASPAYRSDVENPSFQLQEDDSKFALVIGVENYQAVPKADYAARDARSVKSFLMAEGYPERNIVLLTDEQAGKSAFEKYLEAWLPRNTDANSSVLFYFSGHGSPDVKNGEAYLMPWDADPKYVETTGYPVDRLYAKLNALKARRVLVALDACFSGAGGRSVIAKGARPLVTRVDDGGSSVGRIGALTASASDEITGTDDASGHGLFTYQLLKSIDARGGKGTLKEFYDALLPKVRDAARRDNRDQTPQLLGDGRAAF